MPRLIAVFAAITLMANVQVKAQDISDAEQALLAAARLGNGALQARFTAPDAFQIADTGTVVLGVEVVRPDPDLKSSDLKIQQFGDVGLVSGVQTGSITKRFLRVGIRRGEQWQVVHAQYTPIATTPVQIPPSITPPVPTVWPTGSTPDERALLVTQRRENESFQRRDVAAYDELTADDFVAVGLDGRTSSRAEVLKGVTSGTNTRIDPNHSEHRLRVYGSIATVSYLNTSAIRRRVTAVYVKQDGMWKQLFRQQTLVVVR